MKRVLASLLIVLGGCLQTREQVGNGVSVPTYQVKCGGECLELNKHAATDQDALLDKVAELLKQGRRASAENLVEQHAEAAILLLRRRDPKRAATESELKLAGGVDALLQHPRGDGWQEGLQGRGRGIDRAEDTLQKAQDLSRSQQWTRIVELLQKNNSVVAPYPFHAIHTSLILAEAHRNLGQANAASQAWRQSAVIAARLSPRLHVPDLWEQLAAQRPVSTPWATEGATALLANLPASLHDLPRSPTFAPEALVWFTIGNSRLARGEASEALSAFKRADSHGAFPHWDDFLMLYQAKALLGMQQTPAATSLLTTLVARPANSPWRSPALALLGSGKLQEGHTRQAFAFLREAVESNNTDYLWRADAEANLGLAYLAVGDEVNGLRSLHTASDRFTASRDLHGLLQCLENEMRYLHDVGRTEDGRHVQERIRECESRVR